MSSRIIEKTSQLLAVEIESFRDATRDINFDVYLKLSDENVAHVFSRTTGLDYKRLAQYIHKGVKHLFIHPDDFEAYRAFISRPAHEIFNDPDTPQEKKIATLLNMTEQNMAELFTELNVEEKTADAARRVIRGYVELMTSRPQSLAVILRLVSHGEYLYYHSIAVAIFSMFIAKASGQFNQRTLELVSLGGFLHDIGETKLQNPDPTHPKIGLHMLESTPNIPDEVRYVVYQHHEQPGGGGYPNGIHGPVIFYPAKIVALADSFSALISKRQDRPAYPVEQAIKIMEAETLEGKFDRDLMKVVASLFLRQSKSAA